MKNIIAFFTILAMCCLNTNSAMADCCYVTDAGGCAYDECRTCVNLAPAIALGTVVVIAIIALAVQNTHHHSGHCDRSSSSSCFSHSGSCNCFSSGSCGCR